MAISNCSLSPTLHILNDVAHSAKADQSYYTRRRRVLVPLVMCYIVPLNQIAYDPYLYKTQL